MLKATFKIVSGKSTWGNITGNIQDQTDLIDTIDSITGGLEGEIEAVDDKIDVHIADKANPHEVTATQVGLGNVDNTSDLDKPISTATQTALDGKVDKLSTKPTAGTYTKVTINNEGQVTAGTTLQASDIPSLTLSKISDVTASASEVNILDGATLTTTELNYVDGVTSPIQTQISANANNISDIQNLIPNAATVSNQLADKNFVNSSISTNTSNFIGTFNSIDDLEAYSGTVTNNDYAFVVNHVVTDNGNDWATFNDLNAYDKTLLTNFDYAWVINGANFDLYRFDILNQTWDSRATNVTKASVTLNTAYNRYKATVLGSTVTWDFEYTLNNSSFTADQWAAINSGATTTKIGQIATNTNDISTINTTLSGYGNIVTHNTSEFATAAQGTKADTALQQTDIVSSVDSSSTNTKAVGAKLFYDTCGDIETLINAL